MHKVKRSLENMTRGKKKIHREVSLLNVKWHIKKSHEGSIKYRKVRLHYFCCMHEKKKVCKHWNGFLLCTKKSTQAL